MNRPEDMHARFAAAFNSGDVDAIMALYDRDRHSWRDQGKRWWAMTLSANRCFSF